MPQLPEIREPDAPPHIAAIYADIKTAAVLPQVNLIFRYFATKEGVLEWVWQSLRPLYVSNELAEAAQNLTQSIAKPGPSPLNTALSGDDQATAKRVLASYNSGNPQNLIALTALIRKLNAASDEPTTPAAQLTPRPSQPPADPAAFPPLPRRDALPPETMARIEKMSACHPGAPGVIPSMYLHLALWPAALAATDAYLQPLIEAPGWQPLVAGVIEQAGQSADALAPAVHLAPNAPDPATLSEASVTVEAFINTTIPELITVGRLIAID